MQEPLPDMNMGGMPPMDEPQVDNGGMMGDTVPPMDGSNEMGNQFDNDFDAGVDADEEKDPRRYIEQLAGKLSQKLNDYNQNQQQPDSELCKYVVGMVAAQATKGLSPEDAEDVIKKIKSDEEFEEPQEENNDEPISDNGPQEMDNGGNGMPTESKQRRHKSIDEVFQDLTNPEHEKNIELKKKEQTESFKKTPYIPPNFV